MSGILRNVVAVIVAVVLGSIANMVLVMIGPSIIAPPAGVDVTNMESLKASMHLFEAKHLVFPFLAHAVGSFVAGLTVSFLAAGRRMPLALGIGSFFLVGGIAASLMIPAPIWFAAVDILFAYIPMAWLGYKVSNKS